MMHKLSNLRYNLKIIIQTYINKIFRENIKKINSNKNMDYHKVVMALNEIQDQVLSDNYRPVFINKEGIWFKTDFDFFVFSNLTDRILELDKNGKWESIETNFILNNFPPNGVFMDIGANIGYFSLVVAKQFNNAKVYAVEPVSKTYEILCKNIAFNQYQEKIIPINSAVGNQQGVVDIIDNWGPKNHIFVDSLNLSKNQKHSHETVEVRTLDNIVNKLEISEIDLIKVDIEGYESYFIDGAKQTLSQLPLLLIEIQQKRSQIFGKQAKQVIESLLGFGYSYLVVSKNKNRIINANNIEEAILEGKDFIFYDPSKHYISSI